MVYYSIWNRLPSHIDTDLARTARALTLHTLKLNSSGPIEFGCDHSLSRLLESARRCATQWCVTLHPGQLVKSASFFRDIENILREQPTQIRCLELAPRLLAFRCEGELTDSPTQCEHRVNLDMTDLNIDSSSDQLALQLKTIQNVPGPAGSALEYLHYQTRGYGHEMFIFNTENYRAIEGKKKLQPLDALFTLASGFKDLFLLAAHGSNSRAQLHYFDLCPQSLLFKKYMYENWDGQDFPGMLKEFISTHARDLVDVVPPLELNKLNVLWQEELDKWGGASEFIAAYRMAQTLPHHYTRMDIVREPETLAKLIAKTPGDQFAVWYSNCFAFTPALAEFNCDLDWIEGQGRRFLASLHDLSVQTKRQVVLYGPDIVSLGKSAGTSRLAAELYL